MQEVEGGSIDIVVSGGIPIKTISISYQANPTMSAERLRSRVRAERALV